MKYKFNNNEIVCIYCPEHETIYDCFNEYTHYKSNGIEFQHLISLNYYFTYKIIETKVLTALFK